MSQGNIMKHTIVFCFILLLAPAFAGAETMYVTDKLEVAVRDGKGMEYKILGVARSDEKVDVLDTEGEYANIRLPGGVEGWMLSRYLTRTLPKTEMLEKLAEDKDQIREKQASALDEINKLKGEKESLEETQQMHERKIKSLDDEYAELKSGCSDFVALRTNYERLQAEMKSNRETLATISAENAELRENTRLMWFIFGSASVLSGFIIGMYLQSLRNRRRRQISF